MVQMWDAVQMRYRCDRDTDAGYGTDMVQMRGTVQIWYRCETRYIYGTDAGCFTDTVQI